MSNSLFALVLAWLLVWIFSPVTRWLGFRLGIVDHPNQRKIHKEMIPSSGGIAIYIAFFLSLFLFFVLSFFVFSFVPNLYEEIGTKVIMLAFLGAIMLILGVYDDRKDIAAHWKLFGQMATSLVAICLGFKIETLPNPFGGVFHLGWLTVPLTLFWFLGFMNSMNLIDGLDGLASGIVSITSLILLLVALGSGDVAFAILMAVLAGATLSFLRFNLSQKRKIFLGDNGSMLLGFLLASTTLIGSHNGATFGVLIVTVLCLGVPICDTAMAIIRRIKRRAPIFFPDHEHIHHRLLGAGLNQKEVVLILLGITLGLGFTALLVTIFHNIGAAAIIVVSGSVVIVAKRKWWLDKLKRRLEV